MNKFKTFLLAGAMLVFVAACSDSGNDASTDAKEPEAADITAAVLEAVEFPSATGKDTGEINDYIELEPEKIHQLSYYICGSGAYPDELLVLKLTDKNYIETAKESIQKRLDSQIETYRDYTPDEMYKLESAKIITKNNWIFFFATSDNDETEKIINSFFK